MDTIQFTQLYREILFFYQFHPTDLTVYRQLTPVGDPCGIETDALTLLAILYIYTKGRKCYNINVLFPGRLHLYTGSFFGGTVELLIDSYMCFVWRIQIREDHSVVYCVNYLECLKLHESFLFCPQLIRSH